MIDPQNRHREHSRVTLHLCPAVITSQGKHHRSIINQGHRCVSIDNAVDTSCVGNLKSLMDQKLVDGGSITLVANASEYNGALFKPLLSLGESEKARRQVHRNDQKMFAVAHGLKRMAFGIAIGINVDLLMFGHDGRGKPYCMNKTRIKFSLSHAGGMVAVTLAQDKEVGVDIDFPRPVICREIAHLVLSPSELEDFNKSSCKSDFFNRRWTQKEAVCKASGLGLSANFPGFTVNDQLLPVSCPITGKDFFVETAPMHGGYISVASEGRKPENLIVDIDPCLTVSK